MRGALICGSSVMLGISPCSGGRLGPAAGRDYESSAAAVPARQRELPTGSRTRRRRPLRAEATASGRPLSRPEAQEAYLWLVQPFNRTLARLLLEEAKPRPDLATLRLLSRRAAEDLALLSDTVRATAWPQDARPAAETLAARARAAVHAWRRRGWAPSVDPWRASQLPGDGGAGDRLRGALGLPCAPQADLPTQRAGQRV